MSKRHRFSLANNYALYYGQGQDELLSRFDVAVVEPAGQNKSAIQRLKDAGTLVLSYLSIMEIHSWSPEFKLLRDEDFLSFDGKPLMNNAYGTFMTSLASKRWQDIIYHRAGSLIFNSEYDGVFLDTIGDIEWPVIPESIRKQLIQGYMDFISRLRQLKSDLIIVQNNGLERLSSYSSGLIDGICWENPRFMDSDSMQWTEGMLDSLLGIRKESGIKIMLLMEEQEEHVHSIPKKAIDNGFLLYIAPKGYISGVNPPADLKTIQMF